MTTAKKERKHKPVRLRCTKFPKCPRGHWMDKDDLMPPGTVLCVQPCDRHTESGYYDLQISYFDKDGKDITHIDPHETEIKRETK